MIELSNSCFYCHKNTGFPPGQLQANHNKYSFPFSAQQSTCFCKGRDIPYKVLDWHLESILLYSARSFLQQYYVDSSFFKKIYRNQKVSSGLVFQVYY